MLLLLLLLLTTRGALHGMLFPGEHFVGGSSLYDWLWNAGDWCSLEIGNESICWKGIGDGIACRVVRSRTLIVERALIEKGLSLPFIYELCAFFVDLGVGRGYVRRE